jgi:hypothetical protein
MAGRLKFGQASGLIGSSGIKAYTSTFAENLGSGASRSEDF